MNRKTARDEWGEEFDLVQNNGRVTLPSDQAGLLVKHLPVLLLVGASVLFVLLATRK